MAGPSQKDLMLAGELYRADDPELTAAHLRAQGLLDRFNQTAATDEPGRRALLTQLLAAFSPGAVLKPPLRCDYGFNIRVGPRTFINYEAVLLDCNRITIGADVQIGPGVHIYTATHPLDLATRVSGLEMALPVSIGDGVWLGGRAVICPGVTVGAGTVVGAGSVVASDLPPGVLAVGNPCRVVRSV
jgi:maltose O-acetyltransferase